MANPRMSPASRNDGTTDLRRLPLLEIVVTDAPDADDVAIVSDSLEAFNVGESVSGHRSTFTEDAGCCGTSLR
jgi:hypothetical protein